jgi:hypothetical protein
MTDTQIVVLHRRMVRRYQELVCWQLANDLKREAYRLRSDDQVVTLLVVVG